MNLIAVIVLIIFWAVDYHREHGIRLNELANRLREEARVVRLAEKAFAEPAGFHRFIEGYCHQMEPTISPAHHIIVTDGAGRVIESMMAGKPDGLDQVMLQLTDGQLTLFDHAQEQFMMAGVARIGGGRILVAQSLAPVRQLIRRQALSRAGSMTILVVVILLVTNILLVRWVRRPIGRLVKGVEAIGQGCFDVQIEPLNSTEMAALGAGINQMACSLGRVERIRRLEMAKARSIHRRLLPSPDLEIPGLSVDVRYISADSVGGDYHDALELPDRRWLLVVADVSGHGLSAALVTAMLKAEFRQAVRQGLSKPEAIAGMINAELGVLLGTGEFVTCLLGLYRPQASDLEYVNCGHEPGLLLNQHGRLEAKLESSGLPLGVSTDATWDPQTVHLGPGDRLCLMTDGLAETPAPDGALWGRERLLQTLRATVRRTPAGQIDTTIHEVNTFRQTTTPPDDITLMVLRAETRMAAITAGRESAPSASNAMAQSCAPVQDGPWVGARKRAMD